MSEETKVQVLPGQGPDGKLFLAPEPMVRGFMDAVAAGSLCDEVLGSSVLANELCEIPAVTGVKIEGCETLVLVDDADDWDIVEPRVIEILEALLSPGSLSAEAQDVATYEAHYLRTLDAGRRAFSEVMGDTGTKKCGNLPQKELPPFYRSGWQRAEVKLPVLSMKHSRDTEPRSDVLEQEVYANYLDANLHLLEQEDLKEVRKWVHSRRKSLSIKREPLEKMPSNTSPSYKEELPEPKISGVWPAESPHFILSIPRLPKEEKVRTLFVGNSVVMVGE